MTLEELELRADLEAEMSRMSPDALDPPHKTIWFKIGLAAIFAIFFLFGLAVGQATAQDSRFPPPFDELVTDDCTPITEQGMLSCRTVDDFCVDVANLSPNQFAASFGMVPYNLQPVGPGLVALAMTDQEGLNLVWSVDTANFKACLVAVGALQVKEPSF